MEETNKRKISFWAVLGCALPVIVACVAVFLVVLGFIKTGEFKKTEKIEQTFTAPVVSVDTRQDSDGDYNHTITIEYKYNGETRTHVIKETTGSSRSSYRKGQMVTFTKYFLPDGTEVTDPGKTVRFVGFVLFAVSAPWIVFIGFILTKSKKKKKN